MKRTGMSVSETEETSAIVDPMSQTQAIQPLNIGGHIINPPKIEGGEE